MSSRASWPLVAALVLVGCSGKSSSPSAALAMSSGNGGVSAAGTGSPNGGLGGSGAATSGGVAGGGTGGDGGAVFGNGGASANAGAGAGGENGGAGGVIDAGLDSGAGTVGKTGGHILHSAGFASLSECAPNGDCPGGTACLHLTSELSFCDAPRYMLATSCGNDSATPDECACMAKTCPTGQVCAALDHTCSCGPAEHNACVDAPCNAPSDCGSGTLCTPRAFILGTGERCFTPGCSADSDCTTSPGGRCALIVNLPAQAGQAAMRGLLCAYPVGDASPCNYYSDSSGNGWCAVTN
jgi:hypothetical protein